jgi:murein DD-endopeptidase MepM/ murein hydrolase activator NlpD
MGAANLLKSKLQAAWRALPGHRRNSGLIALGVAAAALSVGLAEANSRGPASQLNRPAVETAVTILNARPARAKAPAPVVLWEGADLDHDGQADIANPTGHGLRGADAYGEGRFHASRDGGLRLHEGVDYTARAGQPVDAPISGYVARIGYAYPGDLTLRYVEIENPALHLSARVFYVDPDVAVGQAVAVGHPIGTAHTLQQKYPLGITDHVHLEIADGGGRKLDAQRLIVAHLAQGGVGAD